MLITYFKLAFRSLVKHKLSSFINIAGLSVAIGCCIVFFLMLDMEYTSDRFHENAANIFLAVYTLEGDHRGQRWGDSPLALGPALESEFPQIQSTVRILDRQATVRSQDQVFQEKIRFVDPGFLDMFSFPMARGDKRSLFDKDSLILGEKMALKYFGDADPVGRQIKVKLNSSPDKTFFVKGVAKKFPHNASFSFDILVSLAILHDLQEFKAEDWKTYAQATFVQLKDRNESPLITAGMQKHIMRHNRNNVSRPISAFNLEPLTTLSWESQEIERSISAGSTPQALILLFIIGLFLLLQACFNYVNISLGASTGRLKEIGIRKVVGCSRLRLIRQFLGENVLMCLLALGCGLLLTEFILLPGLMRIMESPEKLSLLIFFHSTHLWLFLLSLLFLTGLMAGAYPALKISSLQPVAIMRKSFKLSGKKRFSSIILTFQFGIAFVIICLVAAFLQNNRYQQQRDWGYDQEHVLNVHLETGDQFPILKKSLEENPDLIGTAGTSHAIGRTLDQAVVEVASNKHEVVRFDVGVDYLETVGMRLAQGRFFRSDLSTDMDAAIIVNKRFVEVMGWSHTLDQVVRHENRLFTVVGVVEDFHFNFFFEEIRPAIFRLAPELSYQFLSVKIPSAAAVKTASALRKTWKRLFPDSVYTAFFQNGVFEQGYRNNRTITKIFSVTATVTLLISCMGLFGLVTLLIVKRRKELGIHKVLGASVAQIALLITRRYLLILLAASLFALPVSYVFLKQLLEGIYRYHMPLGPIPFVLAGTAVLGTAFLTVAVQVRQAALKDPVDALRYE